MRKVCESRRHKKVGRMGNILQLCGQSSNFDIIIKGENGHFMLSHV